MSVVSGCRKAHASLAPRVQVGQVECQLLKLVGGEPILIPEDVVVRGTTCALQNATVKSTFSLMKHMPLYLNPFVTDKIEVVLRRMDNLRVDHCSRWNILHSSHSVSCIDWEKARFVTLLRHDDCNTGLIILFHGNASFSNGREFPVQNVLMEVGKFRGN
jgi:hypothetical protein